MKSLRLAKDLTLPLDAVTQTIAILAKRRAGKSYTMRRLVEQLFKGGQQVVIVDPKGDQWGVRSAADGKAPGLPIVILGGERGDVPLEPSGGEVVAKLVVEERVSVLLDISLFRKHEVATFMTAFMENLYRLKAKEIYRTPLMLVIDEADAIAPQKPQKGEERMLGAAEDIVRRGGQRGIGCVLVTQRSAVLNKNVLTQAQMLVVLRTIAPQDLAAMKAWIDVHGDAEQGKTLMDSLPSLPVGDAWFWSPGWPTTDGIFARVHVLPIETFDSGATPKAGEKRVEPKQAADVDLDALKRQMAATIEKAKADDPRELRKEVARLKGALEKLSREKSVAPTKTVEKPVLTDVDRALLDKVHTRLDDIGTVLLQGTTVIADRLAAFVRDEAQKAIVEIEAAHAKSRERYVALLEQKGVQKILDKLGTVEPRANYSKAIPSIAGRREDRPSRAQVSSRPPTTTSPGGSHTRGAGVLPASGDVSLTVGERRILTAVAQFGEVDRGQLTVLVGYKATARDTYISRLAQKGLVESGQGRVRVTDAGIAALGTDYEPLPTGAALLTYWRGRLPSGEVRVLDVIVAAYPDGIGRADVGERTQYKPTARDTYISRLASRRLVSSDGRGSVRASEELFD